MNGILRHAMRFTLALCGLLAGSGCDTGAKVSNDYGIFMPPHYNDPTVELIDFGYIPASPVEVGSELTFTVTLNKPIHDGSVAVTIGTGSIYSQHNSPWFVTLLNDQGHGVDETARDGTWTGSRTWLAEYGALESLPVIALLIWDDEASPLELSGPLLIISQPATSAKY